MPTKSAAKKKLSKKKAPAVSTDDVPRQPSPAAPRASRPIVHASYGFPKSEKGLLDWSWASKRLEGSHNYVIVTTRPDGRPHAMGMHGLWMGDAFYFGTHVETRKAKNLASNSHCILINEHLEELIIVEGTAAQITRDELPVALSDLSKKKYGWPMGAMPGVALFKVTPKVVFAFPEKQIATAVTRWIFS